MDAQQLI